MATTKKSTGSSTGKTRTPPSTKDGARKRRELTNVQRNERARAFYRARRNESDVAKYNEISQTRTRTHLEQIQQTTEEQDLRRRQAGSYRRRQNIVKGVTQAPSLPKPGGTVGSYIMILGVGSLILIIAYVAFSNPNGATNVLSTFTQFMTNLASEKPLFKETAANPNPNTISPNSTVGQVRTWLVKNKFPTITQG